MALRHRLSPRLSSMLALLGAALLRRRASGAWRPPKKKAKVAAIGDAAPAAAFRGPGFIGWRPRGQRLDRIPRPGQRRNLERTNRGRAPERAPSRARKVASIGQTRPPGTGTRRVAGKLKQFVGHRW